MLDFLQIILILMVIPTAIMSSGPFRQRYESLILLFLYTYHLFFALIFYQIPSDSLAFYSYAAENLDTFNFHAAPGLQFIHYLVYICIKYLHLSYTGTFLIFSSLSFLGFWILFNIVQTYKIKYLWLILLIPSLHFWTQGLGKDSISFFFISVLIYGAIKNKLHIILLGLTGLFYARPHIAAMFGSIYVFTSLVNSNINFITKLLITIVSSLLAWLTLDFVLQYLNSENILDIYDFALLMQGQNAYGQSSYNVADSSIMFQLFTFLFRPLFEQLNLFYFLASFDNLIYLSIFLYTILNIKFIKLKNDANIYLILSFIVFCLLLAFTLGNLGLALRQKIMIMPFLLIIYAELRAEKRKINKL